MINSKDIISETVIRDFYNYPELKLQFLQNMCSNVGKYNKIIGIFDSRLKN